MYKIIYNQIIQRYDVYYFVLYKKGNMYHCLGLKYKGDYKTVAEDYDMYSRRHLLILESTHIHKMSINDICLFHLHHKRSPRHVILNRTNIPINYHMVLDTWFEKKYNTDKSYLSIEHRQGKINFYDFINFPKRIEDACLGIRWQT